MTLFITANDNERIALLAKLENQTTETFSEGVVCKFGDFGKYRIIHYHSPKQGNEAELEILRAVNTVKPNCVILVGVACGGNSKKQKIGDVLVSHSVIDYDCRKEDYNVETKVETTIWRGARTPSGDLLYRLFNGHYIDWQDKNDLDAQFGDIICSSELLNNPFRKDKIFASFNNEPIGYEMEGASAFRACRYYKITEWILIKGICDFGDGNKNENKQINQEIAAKNSVSLCHYIFSQDGAFDDLCDKNTSKSVKKGYKIPPRNKLFIGRDMIFDTINKALKNNNSFILSGLSGIGKSQIAKEYVHRYYKNYDIVIWITADNYNDLIREHSLCIEYFFENVKSDCCSNDVVIENFKNYFDNENHLIIIDNANKIKFSELVKYLPQKNAKTIITTQNSNLDFEIVEGIRINEFSEIEASNYLKQNTNNRTVLESDDDNVIELVKTVGCFPIAIEYARAYINKRKISIKRYLEVFNEYRIKLFDGEVNDYHQNAIIAWKISLNNTSDTAKCFLYYCSLLNFDSIPVDILFIENKIYSKVEMYNIIIALLSYSLIDVLSENIIRIHPLIQEYIRLEQKEENTYDDYINRQIALIWSSFPQNINGNLRKPLF